jgi:hypothetical protein
MRVLLDEHLDQGVKSPTAQLDSRRSQAGDVGEAGVCSMANTTQNADDRLLLSAEWARVGGGFSVAPAERSVVIEDLLVRSARQSPADYRLFFVSATWLGMHPHLVDMRRFGRELDALHGIDSAVAGAMISVANQVAKSSRLDAAERHRSPLDEPRPLRSGTVSRSVVLAAGRPAMPVSYVWSRFRCAKPSQTLQMRTASASEVSGSRRGMNSCPT